MTQTTNEADLLVLTSNIVTAHVGHNHVSAEALPKLIADVYSSLSALNGNKATIANLIAETPVAEAGLANAITANHAEIRAYQGVRPPGDPAVNPAKSIFPDFIICLENGEKFKTLKRHLKAEYNMTPEQYREKWGLPADYPMVARNYSQVRSELAKENRLGGSAPRVAGLTTAEAAAKTRHLRPALAKSARSNRAVPARQ